MPNTDERTEIQRAWLGLVQSSRVLLVPVVDDRPLDQFLAFRDKALELVQSETFLHDLQSGWAPFANGPTSPASAALLLELQAVPRAIEVAEATAGELAQSKTRVSALLGRTATVVGSMKDLVGTLPDTARNALTLFKEVMDIFGANR